MTTFEQELLWQEGFEDEEEWMAVNGDWWPEYVKQKREAILKDDDYFLTKIMEEASEVIQAASKVLLFTADHRYQDGPSNLERLIDEVEDLRVVLDLYSKTRTRPVGLVHPERKVEKLLRYAVISYGQRKAAGGKGVKDEGRS